MIGFAPHLLVLDASVVLDLLLRGPAAAAIEDALFAGGTSLHAPHLLDLEVLQVLRRRERQGVLGGGRGPEVLADLADLGIRRYPHGPFAKRIWEMRHNVTAYDAAYLSLAEALDAELLTLDRSLAAVPGCEAQVVVFG